MDALRSSLPAPSLSDGDGVRVTRLRPPPRAAARGAWRFGAVAVIAATAGWWVARAPYGEGAVVAQRDDAVAQQMRATAIAAAPAVAPSLASSAASAAARLPAVPDTAPDDLPGEDPQDLAAHVSPDEPEPTMGEVIQALHDLGDHTGLGAFNPPGTSPPLRGLAVPPDFELPPGYVRHHQVTDEGEPLEPILMFSPDFSPRDAQGNELALPVDLVVPPHLAPPGLPIREIDIPPRP